MQIHLDHHSGEPIYRQIVEAIKFDVARGKLSAGDRLPSIRQLANELGINMRTVVKAYEELVHAGLAVIPGGQHAFDMFSSPRSQFTVNGVERYVSWVYSQYLAESNTAAS